jgi:uncharacterized protein YkwD
VSSSYRVRARTTAIAVVVAMLAVVVVMPGGPATAASIKWDSASRKPVIDDALTPGEILKTALVGLYDPATMTGVPNEYMDDGSGSELHRVYSYVSVSKYYPDLSNLDRTGTVGLYWHEPYESESASSPILCGEPGTPTSTQVVTERLDPSNPKACENLMRDWTYGPENIYARYTVSVTRNLDMTASVSGSNRSDAGWPATTPEVAMARAKAVAAAQLAKLVDEGYFGGSSASSSTWQSQMLTQVNAVRTKAGLAKLAMCRSLASAAKNYANVLARTGKLSHTGPGGTTPLSRAVAAGYRAGGVGENLAKGQDSVGSVVQAWVGSPGHYANLIGSSYRVAGFGRSDSGSVWVQLFGVGRSGC